MLLAESSHDLRSSFQVSIHVLFTQLSDHHTHPLQRRGEGELTHNTDLKELRSKDTCQEESGLIWLKMKRRNLLLFQEAPVKKGVSEIYIK